MSGMSTFKLAIVGIFGFFIFIGILIFALQKSRVGESSANIVVWGTMSDNAWNALYQNSSVKKSDLIGVSYVRKDSTDFDQEFIEALAEGRGPDIVILRDDSVYKHSNKLLPVSYKSFSERTFKDIYIEEGEMFLTDEGILAFPLMVDPLVMYWNRDMFSNSLVSQPPQYWDQIYSLIDKMTKKDSSGNVLQAAIALGEWRNITNAKEILSMLLLQAGTPITERGNGTISSVLNFKFDYPMIPSESAINFYTQFSNQTSNSYTWNRSLPSSLNMFLGGNLGMYFGFASEIFSIQQKNPNLNFDVTYVPQTRNTAKKTVFGHMYSMSITKQSRNASAAFATINALTEVTALRALETVTNLPPVRRDMLVDQPTDAFRSVFYNSALVSRSWIDPEPTESSFAFRDMIESITSGKSRIYEATSRANDELNGLFK